MPDWQAIIFPDMENGALVALPPVVLEYCCMGKNGRNQAKSAPFGLPRPRVSLSSERPFSPLHAYIFDNALDKIRVWHAKCQRRAPLRLS
jgi:hypothetical protein